MEAAPESYRWQAVYEEWTHSQLLGHLHAHGVHELNEGNSNRVIAIGFLIRHGIPPEGKSDGRTG